MEATKNSIEQLCNITSDTVSKMMTMLKSDLSLEESIKRAYPQNPDCQKYVEILKIAQGLRVGTVFSLIDTGSLLTSEIRATTPIEKRFLMKSTYASISEGYKLIYSLGKVKKHSYLSKLKTMCPNVFIIKIEGIENKLNSFEKSHLRDKVLRDVAYHYNNDMFVVYDKTIEMSNEEDFARIISSYLDILNDIYLLIDEIRCMCVPHVWIPTITSQSDNELINSRIHQAIIKWMRINHIHKIIPNYLISSAKTMDAISRSMRMIKKVKKIMGEGGITDVSITQAAENVYEMQNAYLIMQFYYIDIASIVMAYLNTAHYSENILIIRRMHVAYVSILDHLYGYSEEHQKVSFLQKIIGIIPPENTLLMQNATEIMGQIEQLIDNNDNSLRHLFVHYAENNGNREHYIGEILKRLDRLNPSTELSKSEKLLIVCQRIQSLSKELIGVLAKEAENSRKESEKELNLLFETLNKKIEKINVSQEGKKLTLPFKDIQDKNAH